MKLLGITIDNILTFNEHINNLCRSASYKLHALLRTRKLLCQDQAKLLYNAFINNQFNQAHKAHHQALNFAFNSDAGHHKLLQMYSEITIHQKHLHVLICEVFKSLSNCNTEFMGFYFTL